MCLQQAAQQKFHHVQMVPYMSSILQLSHENTLRHTSFDLLGQTAVTHGQTSKIQIFYNGIILEQGAKALKIV